MLHFLAVLALTASSAVAQAPTVIRSPEVDSSGRVTFRLRAPNAREVVVAGDVGRVAMSKDERGVWTATTDPLPADLYQYRFIVDSVGMLDPVNSLIKPNLLTPSSVVHVRGPASLPWEMTDVPHGAVHRHHYRSRVVGDERDYNVYTPPGYDRGGAPGTSRRYPVLYLLHGFSDDADGWTSPVGRANVILDNLIAQGKATPMLVVMPLGYGTPEMLASGPPGTPRPPGLRERNAQKFGEALLGEVIPAVERDYRVARDASSRAIAGLSMGGFEALFIGLTNPDSFAWVGGFSSALANEAPASFHSLDAKMNSKLHLVWIACGTEDNLIDANRKFRQWLTEKGVRHTAVETPGVHNWLVWRRNLSAFAPLLFQRNDAHAAGHAHNKTPTLGTIVFPNSGKAAAQQPFLRGVALLHSFEYSDAAKAFRAAQAADPGFALAYWGEALTYSHVVWRTENLAASRTALQRLAPGPAERLARARTRRERSFGAAVEAFYIEAPLPRRLAAYADSLRRFAQADPRDQEGAAFASHALMLAGFNAPSRAERDTLLREAIRLSERVLKANPNHPGATHYLIHLYDSPGLAAQGLEFARAYDKIAPDAEHALHMPSHIYLQLGMWADVVASNERAWPASRAADAPSWHTLSWLQYGYLQQGRWDAARALIDSARAIVPALRGYETDAAFVIPRLEFQYASATGRWMQALTQPPAASGEMSEREVGFRRFAGYWSAVSAAQRNDSAALATFAAPFVARADSLHSGPYRITGSVVALANALVVHALVAKSRGDRDGYLRSLRVAAEQERQLEAFVGPPERLFASELLGAELIAQGRAAEAVGFFETVLRVCPGRSEALIGLVRAKSASGDRAGADAALAKLRVNWGRADSAALGILAGVR